MIRESGLDTRTNKNIAIWLFVCCAMVFLMVVIGGLTRLTGSGLSMVKWSPLLGWLPPLNDTAWQQVFDYYKESPQFLKVNYHIDLEGFKDIFWLEYIHRLLGRLVGVVFLLPFLYFLVRKQLAGSLRPKLAIMFILGGLQGVMGWYMVKSGLVNNPQVSQYRLTAHLGLAFIIHAYMFWVALGLYFGERPSGRPVAAPGLAALAGWLSGLVFLTVLSGGFVAGLHAGLAFNTFPLMNGRLIPTDFLLLEPVWHNFFENIATVQWDHRLLALLSLTGVIVLWLLIRKGRVHPRVRFGGHLLLAMVLIQLGLGIATLLTFVPISLASIHQAGAVVLFTLMLFVTNRLRHEPPEA